MALNKQDIKEWSSDELAERIRSEKLRLQKARFNHAIAGLDNPMELRAMRRDIARLSTELRRRQIAEAAK